MIFIYTILINENNELINTTPKERILQRSKLVNKLHFLTSPIYKDFEMSLFTATLEYVLPISKRYRSENLVLSQEFYKDQLEYVLPIDTILTQEHGDIELQITFTYVHRGSDGQMLQHVRKTTPTTITITPIAAWSDFIPDDALTSLDQRLLKIDAIIQDLNEFNTNLDKTKADNISLEKNIIQLTSHGEKIGDAHLLPSGGGGSIDESGVPVVEFSNTTSRSVEVNKDIGYEVVEF